MKNSDSSLVALSIISILCFLLVSCATTKEYLRVPFSTEPQLTDWAKGRFHRDYIPLNHAGSAQLSYVRAGQEGAQRVIFIHGTPGYSADWISQLTSVPPDREYIAIDRPGFGFSGPRIALSDLSKQAEAITPLLQTENNSKVILVGFSLGGSIAVRVALDNPERIAGLVLASANLDPELQRMRWYNHMASWLIFTPFIQKDWLISNREMLPLAEQFREMEPALSSLHVPISIIHSQNDNIVSVKHIQYVKDKMQNARFVFERIVQGSNHMLPIDSPELTTQAIDMILSEGCCHHD